MIHTIWNILLTILCLLWYIFVLTILTLSSRKRILSFNLVISCIKDIFDIWDCDIESVIFRLNQIKKKK